MRNYYFSYLSEANCQLSTVNYQLSKIMKKNRIIELVVKVAVAALTAFLTALGTTSCMGHGPI